LRTGNINGCTNVERHYMIIGARKRQRTAAVQDCFARFAANGLAPAYGVRFWRFFRVLTSSSKVENYFFSTPPFSFAPAQKQKVTELLLVDG
jgi:hypothetical protein